MENRWQKINMTAVPYEWAGLSTEHNSTVKCIGQSEGYLNVLICNGLWACVISWSPAVMQQLVKLLLFNRLQSRRQNLKGFDIKTDTQEMKTTKVWKFLKTFSISKSLRGRQVSSDRARNRNQIAWVTFMGRFQLSKHLTHFFFFFFFKALPFLWHTPCLIIQCRDRWECHLAFLPRCSGDT